MSKNIKTRDDSANYTATVIKLPVKQAIEGLDNLVQVQVFGNVCLIGKTEPTDRMYLYFPAGTQLSQQFLAANKLYRDVALNVYSEPEKELQQKGGFFEPNGRVKALKLRGIISTGFVVPITSLELMLPYSKGGDISTLEVGDEFNEWCGVEVCRKYIAKQIQTSGQPKDKTAKINNKLADLLIPNQFRFHTETAHLAKNLHRLNPDDIIVITDKWHGSSCILSKVYVNTERGLNLAKRLWNKYLLLPKFKTREIAGIYSSGKPKSALPKGVDSHYINTGVDYYGTNIWKETYEKYKNSVEEGVTLYGELVGFTSGGSCIQNPYDYKNEPNQSRFMVYRITYTKPNGEFIEFGWQQIKDYCQKYGLEHVKQWYYGRAGDLFPEIEGQEDWPSLLFSLLQTSYNMEHYCSENNNKVPAEGIVLRIDGKLNSYEAYKLKSKLFILGESNSDEVNLEDQQ
jgi:hypothetical protein